MYSLCTRFQPSSGLPSTSRYGFPDLARFFNHSFPWKLLTSNSQPLLPIELPGNDIIKELARLSPPPPNTYYVLLRRDQIRTYNLCSFQSHRLCAHLTTGEYKRNYWVKFTTRMHAFQLELSLESYVVINKLQGVIVL